MSILASTGTRLTMTTSLALVIAFASSRFVGSGSTWGKDAREKGMECQTGYAPIHGLRIYYEIHRTRNPAYPPLVLLHGGGDTIQTSFGHVLAELAGSRQLIAFEQQGYIVDRPFSFEQSAHDTAALLDYLHVEHADLFGFSNGGTIALQVAIRHPHLVRKLVIASGFFSRDGAEATFWNGFEHPQLKDMPQELRDSYLAVAPHRENLEMLFQKAVRRMGDFRDIPADALRHIGSPALVVDGDRDVERPEHAILPGTDHGTLMSRSAWLVPMVQAFLDAPMPPSP